MKSAEVWRATTLSDYSAFDMNGKFFSLISLGSVESLHLEVCMVRGTYSVQVKFLSLFFPKSNFDIQFSKRREARIQDSKFENTQSLMNCELTHFLKQNSNGTTGMLETNSSLKWRSAIFLRA